MQNKNIYEEIEQVKSELTTIKQQLNVVTDELFKMRIAQSEIAKHKKQTNTAIGIVLLAWTLLFALFYLSV